VALSIESTMNLAVAGLMIPSTSMVKTGAFSWLGISAIKANREKTERMNNTLFLFKICSPKFLTIPQNR
jgi:Na+/H+ antiporter NhaD/arsenite permease-like protein